MSLFLYGANIAAGGIRQHYLRYGGTGAPLLVLPGITSPATTWGFVAERLATLHDTYVLDFRGRGLSEVVPPYDVETLAADAAALIEALGLGPCNVLGHSMGARVAIRLARRRPELLGRLVLADPPVTGPGRRTYPTPLSWYVDSIRIMTRGGSADDLRPFSPTWALDQLRLRAEWLHTCDESAIVASYEDFHQADIHADLPHLSIPMRLVRAGKGGVISDDDLTELCNLQPALDPVTLRDAGHMLPWDDLEGFLAAIDGAFDTAATPSRASSETGPPT
jgi:N-formylmaleamate deformylase